MVGLLVVAPHREVEQHYEDEAEQPDEHDLLVGERGKGKRERQSGEEDDGNPEQAEESFSHRAVAPAGS